VAFLAALVSLVPAQGGGQPPGKEDAPKKGEKGKKGAKKEEPPKKDDSYRQFFRQPESVLDYWKAMQFEIEVGRPELAAKHLHGMMAKNPTEAELLELEEQEGMSNILALRLIRKWDEDPKADKAAKEDLEKLINGVSTALNKHLSDRQRIAKYVKNLASPEEDERAYALTELTRSGARIVPALVAALRESSGDERQRLLTAIPKLGRETIPPLLAALDIPDHDLRLDLIGALLRRADARAVPYLWYLAGGPGMEADLKARAHEALAYLLRTPADSLPSPKAALTQEAEKYYQHKINFPDPERVTVWRWDGKDLVSSTQNASKAEEYFGLRFARQALDIDPAYEPAQLVFLSLALDKATEPLGLDQPLTKGPPAVNQLLATVNPSLVTAVLERALTDRRTAVIIGAARALGALGEIRAERPGAREEPALVRALKYPDRRVQLVAADALLRIPGKPMPPANARVVEVLRRTAAADPAAKVIVADANRERAMLIAQALRKAGFEPVVAGSGREVLKGLHEAADIDAVFVDAAIRDPQLPYLLSQLRADMYTGLLPVFVTIAPSAAPGKEAQADNTPGAVQRRLLDRQERDRQVGDRAHAEDRLRQLAREYRNVWVVPASTDPDVLKGLVAERIAEEMGRPLTEAERREVAMSAGDRLKRLVAERKDHADRALIWLGRIARGETDGYDLRPAADTLLTALRSGRHSPEATAAAIAGVSRIPGSKPQAALADAVLNPQLAAGLRSAAAVALVRHIQQNGLLLNQSQTQAMEALASAKDTDPELRPKVASVIGSLRPDSRLTGERLKGYTPSPAPAPAPDTKDK
jgi:CheY-like chemotaxis protein